MILLLVGLLPSRADDAASPVDTAVDFGGDVKSIALGILPYDSDLLMPDAPQGTGIFDGRLKFEGRLTRGDLRLRLQVHQATTATSSPPPTEVARLACTAGQDLTTGGAMAGFFTGVGVRAPEAVALTFDLVEPPGDCDTAGNLLVRTRTDRLALAVGVPHVDLTVGRQPVTFGRALLFTPMDLVNPFNPAVVDQEYKPGVDAVRVDAYMGMSANLTAVAAYAGAWDLAGSVLALSGGVTSGIWDLYGIAGAIHGDAVGGLGTSGGLGPVGVRAEVTGTKPAALAGGSDEDPFARAVAGADWRPTGTTFLTGEVYYQGVGAHDPADYLDQAASERYARGELWALGQWYAGLSASWEARPTLTTSAFALVNLADGSAMVGPGLAWSVANNADVVAGAWFGLGERPPNCTLDDLVAATIEGKDPTSAVKVPTEMGMVPGVLFVEMRAWF